jgi:hypothetical protein
MRLVTVGGFVATVVLASVQVATASPPLPSVDALGPGVGLASYDASDSGGGTCTAGFLVHDRKGQIGLLSAAHCDEGGAVAVKLGASYDHVGSFSVAASHGDIGLISLAPGLPTNPSVNGTELVEGVTDQVSTGEVLCKVGLATDRQCGPITDANASTVTFTATTQCGDSGGPVYAINADGSVTAVGITIGGTMGAGTVPPPCGTAYTSAVAQLIQPWLHSSSMALVTS